MKKFVLPLLASLMVTTSPTGMIATASAAMADDHPAPPYEVSPECEAQARVWAARMDPNDGRDVWGPWYVYYYETYIIENCGI